MSGHFDTGRTMPGPSFDRVRVWRVEVEAMPGRWQRLDDEHGTADEAHDEGRAQVVCRGYLAYRLALCDSARPSQFSELTP